MDSGRTFCNNGNRPDACGLARSHETRIYSKIIDLYADGNLFCWRLDHLEIRL